MNKRILLLDIILLVIIVAGLGFLGRNRIVALWDEWMAEPEPTAITVQDIINRQINQNANANANASTAPIEPEVVIPEEFNLAVPFTTQSPYAKWTEQENESCEEASALMVHYYWQDKTFTKDIATEELQTIVDFENEIFGYYKDTTAEETAEFIKELWGYQRVEVKYDITLEDIKKEVAQGRPVILPSAGRLLGNPNFRQPGPLYHMLVVRGWTKDKIITNDPGTRKGEGYQYEPEVLLNAVHDWNGGDVENGRAAMIVIYPNG